MKSAELQQQINELDQLIQNGAALSQLNLWEMERTEKRKELEAILAEEANQQAHEVKLQEATESIGYILDTMVIEGFTIAELITDDDVYKLVRAGVQNVVVEITEKNLQSENELKSQHQAEIKAITERAENAEYRAEKLNELNNEQGVKIYQIEMENTELGNKVTKGADLLIEANSQIEQQKQHIGNLQTDIAIGVRGSLNVVNVPQDTSKLAAEIMAKKVRITDVKFQDETGIDRRIKTAVEVLTGKEISYEAIYEKRYIILNLEESAQYRAEIEQKKVEEEALNAVIPTIETNLEPVLELEAPAKEVPFQETMEDTNSQGDSTDVRNESVEQVVAEESEVITLESLHERVKALEAKAA
jgi:hypothetical protein